MLSIEQNVHDLELIYWMLYTQTLLYRKYQQFLSNLLQTKKDKLYFILREPLSQQINEEAHSSNEDV